MTAPIIVPDDDTTRAVLDDAILRATGYRPIDPDIRGALVRGCGQAPSSRRPRLRGCVMTGRRYAAIATGLAVVALLCLLLLACGVAR